MHPTLRYTSLFEKYYTCLYYKCVMREQGSLGNQDTSTTSCLNLLLSTATEVTSLDNERLGRDATTSQNLSITSLKGIDNWDLSTILLGGTDLLRDQSQELVNIDGGAPGRLASQVDVTHTNLTKVTRMETVHVDAVMVHTTGETTTSRMLTMLTDTTVTG